MQKKLHSAGFKPRFLFFFSNFDFKIFYFSFAYMHDSGGPTQFFNLKGHRETKRFKKHYYVALILFFILHKIGVDH